MLSIRRWNCLFWLAFVVLGALIIAGSIVRIIYIDLIFGLMVVAVGAAKLGEELTDRKLRRKQSAMHESIQYLTGKVESASSVAENVRDRSDSRFFRIDQKRQEIEEKMESNYRDLVRKSVGIENRVNDLSKMMLEIAKRQEALKAKVPAPTQAFFPKPVATQESRIMRFGLPKIAPKKPVKAPARKKARKAKPVRRKPKRRARTQRTVVENRIIIQAPKASVKRFRAGRKRKRKPVAKKKVRAKPKARPARAKALKRKASKKVKAKPKGRLKKVELLIREK
jgi:hypothetical protein